VPHGTRLSPRAKADLDTAILRDRERLTGNNGESAEGGAAAHQGSLLGKTQAAIAPGSFGPVNFWTGPKGNETDSGITVQVYLRANFASQSIGTQKFVIFESIDRGYEITVANPCG